MFGPTGWSSSQGVQGAAPHGPKPPVAPRQRRPGALVGNGAGSVPFNEENGDRNGNGVYKSEPAEIISDYPESLRSYGS